MDKKELATQYARLVTIPTAKRMVGHLLSELDLESVDWDSILEPTIKIYAEILTEKELKAILKWMATPVSKSINEKALLHFEELQQAIADGMEKHKDCFADAIDKEVVKQIVKRTTGETGPTKSVYDHVKENEDRKS